MDPKAPDVPVGFKLFRVYLSRVQMAEVAVMARSKEEVWKAIGYAQSGETFDGEVDFDDPLDEPDGEEMRVEVSQGVVASFDAADWAVLKSETERGASRLLLAPADYLVMEAEHSEVRALGNFIACPHCGRADCIGEFFGYVDKRVVLTCDLRSGGCGRRFEDCSARPATRKEVFDGRLEG